MKIITALNSNKLDLNNSSWFKIRQAQEQAQEQAQNGLTLPNDEAKSLNTPMTTLTNSYNPDYWIDDLSKFSLSDDRLFDADAKDKYNVSKEYNGTLSGTIRVDPKIINNEENLQVTLTKLLTQNFKEYIKWDGFIPAISDKIEDLYFSPGYTIETSSIKIYILDLKNITENIYDLTFVFDIEVENV